MPTNTSKVKKETLIVIPARLQSQRLPNKPLLMHNGKTLLDYTYEQAKKTIVGTVVIATDDQIILDYCKDKEIDCIETPDCSNGTARCFYAYIGMIEKDFVKVINWQVDEPLIDPIWVNVLINSITPYDPSVHTITAPITEAQLLDKNTVKAIVTKQRMIYSGHESNRCHWFTRSPVRENRLGHCGIYGFSVNSLWNAFQAKKSFAATSESLEQLSWIDAGITVESIKVDTLPLSINTPEDWTTFCNEN